MPVDILASEPHFADHLYPVWQALKDPGDFILTTELISTKLKRWEGGNGNVTDISRPVLVASYGDLKRARQQGRTRIALIEHGYGQSYSIDHPSYAGGRNRDDVSLFLVPNEHAAQRNRDANPMAAVEIVGCPKLDSLPTRQATDNPLTIAISFHFDAHSVAPEATGTLRYYRSALTLLAQNYHTLGHGHPRALRAIERHYRRPAIEVVADFADVCRRADLYICDNSSTLYEFAHTGRPVVVLNGPQYRRNVSHGLRFWDAATVGVQVDHPQHLLPAIATALEDASQQRQAREAALARVYAHRSGGAQRAATALQAWAA